MAVTVTSISPTIGHSGGRTFVEIEGSGFRIAPTLSAGVDGITPEAPPSVRVTFGGVEAVVEVASSGLLYATTAPADPTDEPVDVVVTNLDDDGVPIVGETATLEDAWRYVRPNLSSERSDLVRVIDTFIAELKRQVCAHVVMPEHTDFDPDTTDTLSLVDVETFPGIIVAAVQLDDNDFYAHRGEVEVDGTDETTYTTVAEPVTVDVVFSLVGYSNNKKEVINLAATTKRFFKKNPYLTMDRDPDDAGKGKVRYELTAEESRRVKIDIDSNDSNLTTFAITARVVGFDIEIMPIDEGDESLQGVGKTVADDGVVLSIESRG